MSTSRAPDVGRRWSARLEPDRRSQFCAAAPQGSV